MWRRDGGRRWEEPRRSPVWEGRRSPVWEPRRSASPERDRHHRYERKERPDRWGRRDQRDPRGDSRGERSAERDARGEREARGERSRDRRRSPPPRRNDDRDRELREVRDIREDRSARDDRGTRDDRSTRDDRNSRDDRYSRDDRNNSRDERNSRDDRNSRDARDIPSAPSPPCISQSQKQKSRSRSQSCSRSEEPHEDYEIRRREEEYEDTADLEANQQVITASPGDWYCLRCGSYNFKRRIFCFRRKCFGKKTEGVIFGGDNASGSTETNAGITKRLLFRRLDALTTEEKILDAMKDHCSKQVLDSIAGITIGRETLTGASKCLAYINFNSIADSTAAYTELMALKNPLVIDNREVLISYYNEPAKQPKHVSNIDYAAYYAQAAAFSTNTQAMSEADRVNAAAAVAQSAITAAHARQWTPMAAPTFVSSATQNTCIKSIPIGDGKTTYSAPDVRTFLYDETSGYYYDPGSGLYYDGKTQYFFNNQTNQYMYWDASTSTYISATQQQQNTEQPKLPNPPQATIENTIVKEPEEKKKKEKDDKVKVAKKIAKDMERWARTLNQKKEIAKSNYVQEQVLDTSASKGSVDIGFSVLSAGPSIAQPLPKEPIREPSPPPEEFLMKKQTDGIYENSDDGIIDWSKLTCLLCKRRFPSHDVLNKHKTLSDLHKQNLAEYRKKNDLLPQINGYRDRAAERRMKFGEDEVPIAPRKRYEPPPTAQPPPSHPPPSVVDTIGGKMLQKMGWSQGRGLGKEEQGRIAPIEAEQRPSLAGLGQKRGIYTPTPGETYRDTVKKLMIARYKEVVGTEDGD